MKLKIGEKYHIYWVDTFSFNGWWNDDELKIKSKKMVMFQESVGFFAGEYSGFIILATHFDSDKDFKNWGHPDWIPKGCIKKIRKLK